MGVHAATATLKISSLYAAHATWLQGWLRRHTGCSHRAAELAHDTFCRLLERPQAAAPDTPRSYLATVARHLLIDDIRRRELERAVAEACAIRQSAVDVLTPERIAEAVQFLDAVMRLLDSLPEQAQRAFVLRRIDGLEHRDIAIALGISLSTVKRHIALAYARCYAIAYED
jgi:RNA polymerase sigma-70 factor (ECF subfamily)